MALTKICTHPQFVKFNGSCIPVVMQNNQPYVAVKVICDALNLDWGSQFRRINRDAVLKSTIVMMTTVAEDGKQRPQICLPLEYLNGWMFGIDESRVDAAIRDKVIHYKRDCYKALFQHFFGAATSERKTLVRAHERVLPKAKELPARLADQLKKLEERLTTLRWGTEALKLIPINSNDHAAAALMEALSGTLRAEAIYAANLLEIVLRDVVPFISTNTGELS